MEKFVEKHINAIATIGSAIVWGLIIYGIVKKALF